MIVKNVITIDGAPHKMLSRSNYASGCAFEKIAGNKILFDVGFLSGILQQCGVSGFYDELRVKPDFRPGPLAGVLLEPDQETALQGILMSDEAVCRMVPGQGHIVVGLETLRRRRTTALILTDTNEQAKAWNKALQDLLQIDDADKVQVWDRESFMTALDDWQHDSGSPMWDIAPHLEPGLLIVDQINDWSLEDLRRAGRAWRPAYRLGFTNSPSDSDEALFRHHVLGPLVFDGVHAGGFILPSQFNWQRS